MPTTRHNGQIGTPKSERVRQEKTTSCTGRVFKKSLGTYWVHSQSRVIVCSITNRLRKHLHYPEADPSSLHQRVVKVTDIEMLDPIAVGDTVLFVETANNRGQIRDVLPRRNKLTRKAAGPRPLEQIIAANVDQIMVVMAVAQPTLKLPLLDRYLLDAEAAGIPAIVCLTKADLVDDAAFFEQFAVYKELGYPIYITSAQKAIGLEEILDAMRHKITVFTGISGVGKSSLLNTLQPGLGLKVNEISKATGKGKHTTTHLEMHQLDCDGWVIDTPGMREFGIWKLEHQDIAMLFPEMRNLPGTCHFDPDCTHVHEPGCIIRQAVQAGKIAQHRYASYVKLYHEIYAKPQKHQSKRKARLFKDKTTRFILEDIPSESVGTPLEAGRKGQL